MVVGEITRPWNPDKHKIWKSYRKKGKSIPSSDATLSHMAESGFQDTQEQILNIET